MNDHMPTSRHDVGLLLAEPLGAPTPNGVRQAAE
jgi:hypothetical protein